MKLADINDFNRYSELIEENLCKKLKSLASWKKFYIYFKRKILRYFLKKPDWLSYIDKSFSWITGQYALGLLSTGTKKSVRILTRYYNSILLVKRLGIPVFEVPDQIIHAEVMLKLYYYYGKKRYLPLIQEAAVLLKTIAQTNDGHIIYWPPEKSIYIDTLGMISDFCYSYEEVFHSPELSDIARYQIEYVERYCIDSLSGFPYHSYDYEERIGGGSSTWGRGVGWYLFGLTSYVKKYGLKTERLERVFFQLFEKQDNSGFLYNDVLNPTHIDTSTTVMASLCLAESITSGLIKESLIDNWTEKLLLCVKALLMSIDENGEVLNCSGECSNSGKYSMDYGNYFAQGYTLMLLNRILKETKLTQVFENVR